MRAGFRKVSLVSDYGYLYSKSRGFFVNEKARKLISRYRVLNDTVTELSLRELLHEIIDTDCWVCYSIHRLPESTLNELRRTFHIGQQLRIKNDFVSIFYFKP